MPEPTRKEEEIQRLLKTVVDHFSKEDESARHRQIRMWRKLKLYWNSFQHVWYDSVAHDWRVPEAVRTESNLDQGWYDKPVNVFRAYLESIIAALSVTVPAVRCFPDDATNPLDLSTAKAGDKISELIYKHNDVILLWINALYIYCTEGLVACYNYTKEDKEYGEYETPEYETTEEKRYECPFCESPITPDTVQCPTCENEIDPTLIEPKIEITQKLVGVTKHPKSRQCLEVYGGLYIKVANWAKKQADTPYLIFSYETHYTNALERYDNLRDKDGKPKIGNSSGGFDEYDQWGRLSPQYRGEYPTDNVTVRNCWLRPCAFNILDEDECKELKEKYPDGVKVVYVNDIYAEAFSEKLDDHWTLTQNPLSDYLHHDPLGMLLISVQDITNDLISLILQTIEHGITEVFVDQTVVNLEQYQQREVAPGNLTAVKSKAGKSLGDSFHEIKTAVLSGEVLPFAELVQSMGQLVSGALPSLFGGVQSGGSKTASQYAMSRAQALQRLQTPWKVLTIWWKTIFGKVIPAYIRDVQSDEHFVQQDELGNFVNVFIRKAELQGKIGNVELESDENLPVTWSQKKDIIMGLMQAGNPMILEALLAPENLPFIKEAIGLPEFIMPGENDRQKQYEEIQQLLNSEPMVLPPDPMMAEQALMTGMLPQDIELPSVEVDPLLDNHQIEANICRNWLTSEAGRLAKFENPAGYKNVLLHMKAHMQFVIQATMAQQGAMQPTEPKKESPNEGGTNQQAVRAPIGEENASI